MTRRYTGASPEVKDLAVQRACHRCERCADPDGPFQHHHRRPRAMGGTRRPESNAVSALVLLCEACHAHVESHRAEALDDGWLVRQHHDPSSVPLWLNGEPVLLTSDGRYQAYWLGEPA